MSFVKKLDDPTEFAAIKTGIKTVGTLKKHEQERWNVWYNHFYGLGQLVPPTKGSIQWVADHYITIEKYIRDTYVEPIYKPSTLRNHLEGLANILLAIDKTKFKEVVRPYYNLGLSLQQIIDKSGEESVFSDKELENFVTYDELVTKRDSLEKEWMEEPKDLKLNMFHLLLSINTYVPPLRLDWIEMNIYPPRLKEGAIIKKRVDPSTLPPPPENNENYLWEEKEGQWSLVINSDKIENKRKSKDLPCQIMRLNDDIPAVTNGARLNELINLSLTYAPRDYVLIGVRTKTMMGESGYNSALSSMFAPRKPTQNVLRKAYINHWHGQNLSTGKLKEIAFRMRHTLGVAMGSYRKINASGDIKSPPFEVKEPLIPEMERLAIVPPIEIKTLPIVEPPKVPLPVLPRRAKYNPVEYSRNYREYHKAELDRKRREEYERNTHKVLRQKLIYHLNRGLTTRPTQLSILKYGLAQSEVDGRWYTTQPDLDSYEASYE